VVNARIEPQLIQEGQAFLPHLLVQLLHLLADVRGSDKIAAQLQACPRNVDMQECRNVADYYVGGVDYFLEFCCVLDLHLAVGASFESFLLCEFLRFGEDMASYVDAVLSWE